MNAVFGASINLPANQPKILDGTRIGTAYKSDLARNILARMKKLPGAVGHLIVGPPMSEKERYKQMVAEARARNLEGLAGAWWRPR